MADTVPVDGRCWWFDTHASIPANWSRDTAADGRLLLGGNDSYTGPVNAGSATHTHTVNSHRHILADHQHVFSGDSLAAGSSTVLFFAPTASRPPATHNHSQVSSNFRDTASESDATTIVVNAGNNWPGRVFAIVIKPDDGLQDIPDDAYAITDEAAPTGYSTVASGMNDRFYWTPDTGNDGGGITGLTHTHSVASHSHTFTETHGHAAKRAGNPSSTVRRRSTGPDETRGLPHHVVTLAAAAGGLSNTANAPPTPINIEPVHIRMRGITNTSGGALTSDGVIIPYVGSVASLSSFPEWQYCNGSGVTPDLRDRFIQIGTAGDIGGIGAGTTSHSHDATDKHTHPTFAHTHGAAPVTLDLLVSTTIGMGRSVVTHANHFHDWSVQSETPDLELIGYTTSSNSHVPSSRSVIFIKKVAVGAAAQPAIVFGANF